MLRIGGDLWTRDFNPLSGTWCNYIDPHYGATKTVEYAYAKKGINDPAWKWQFAPSMAKARANTNATLLPDSTILVTGGKTNVLNELLTTNPVRPTELSNDAPWLWRTLINATVRRGYHSTALLLPSGKVLTAGGEEREKDYEVFQPPYMTNGTVRPVILHAPNTLNMSYGSTYGLEYQALQMGHYIDKVVLMAPGSITHHTDMHARYVELDIDQDVLPPDPPPTNPMIFFKAPPDSKHAPKGYYMLFLVTNPQGSSPKGTPSTATWVKLQ